MSLLCDVEFDTDYGQYYVCSDLDRFMDADMEALFARQRNGTVGAAEPGGFVVLCRGQWGPVHLRAELLDGDPGSPSSYWEDVVEVTVHIHGNVEVHPWADDDPRTPLALSDGIFRVRLSVSEPAGGGSHDGAHDDDSECSTSDDHLLQFWPADSITPDSVVRQSDGWGRYQQTEGFQNRGLGEWVLQGIQYSSSGTREIARWSFPGLADDTVREHQGQASGIKPVVPEMLAFLRAKYGTQVDPADFDELLISKVYAAPGASA